MNSSRFADRHHCIDDNSQGKLAPILDQVEEIAAALNDLDCSPGIKAVTMIKDAAGRLGAGITDPGARLGRDEGPRRRFVAGNQAQCLAAGVNDFDPAHEDAAERIAAYGLEPDFVGERADFGWQSITVERIARDGSDEICTALLERRMQRGRVRHLALDELRIVLSRSHVEAGRGDDPPAIHWIFAGMPQGDELVVPDQFRKRKARGPAQVRNRRIARPFRASATGASSERLGTR